MVFALESGFYGKLPCRGDFMQRRVAPGFVDAWDAWLQEGLHASRHQLGSQWLEAYLTSPVWRFVLAEGICGQSAYVGVMLPSVDRVGRYFPLTLVSPLEVGGCLLEAACGAGRAWFDAAESLARKALEAGDLDLEAFDAEVEALAALLDHAELETSNRLMERIARSGFPSGGAAWHICMLAETPQRAANALASIELQRAFRPCALWWTQGSEALEPGWLLTSGLPAPASFAALLSGQWREAGCTSIELAAHPPPQGTPQGQPDLAQPQYPHAVRIAAAHPALRHGPGAGAEPRFVRRPEIGLWGVVIAVDGVESGARADLISDVAHDLAPQATLTAQVESARRALQRALGSRPGAAWGANTAVAAVFLLARGSECALLWSGAVRALRIRRGTVTELLGAEPMSPPEVIPSDPMEAGGAEGADGALLALLATPAPAQPAVNLRYEPLEGDDLWVLGMDQAISQALIGRLLDAWPAEADLPDGTRSADEALAALLGRHSPPAGADEASPLMLLAARITACEAG